MSEAMTPAQLAMAAEHLLAAKMFSLASCVMLFYDIAITFGDEVERIWKQRFTGATVLYFLNRYLSPLGYIVIIVSFHDPSWSKAACQHYILYPEILKIFTATAVGVIFILRLYSIYCKNNVVLISFTALLVFELGVKIWAFTDGVMLRLPPGFVGCILTGRSSPGDRIIYTWVAELVFDSCVFFATLYRTLQLYRRTIFGEALSLITVIMRDGIMYFAAIFVSNLVTVLIFIFAPNDLKVINASFSTLITSLMVSRLMLNLRGEVLRRGPVISSTHSTSRGGESYQLTLTDYHKHPTESRGTLPGWSAFESSVVGNLGAPIITFEHDNIYDFNEDEDEHILDPALPRSSGLPLTGFPRSSDTSPHTHTYPRPAAHRIRPSLDRKPSAENSASVNRLPSLSRAVAQSFRRPRTSESTSSDRERDSRDRVRDVVEMMQTRSLPSPLIVQVTEEVIVDEAVQIPPSSTLRGPSTQRSSSVQQHRSRRPWLAPASWRLYRDVPQQEMEPAQRGSDER